jgi:hypothetical protein
MTWLMTSIFSNITSISEVAIITNGAQGLCLHEGVRSQLMHLHGKLLENSRKVTVTGEFEGDGEKTLKTTTLSTSGAGVSSSIGNQSSSVLTVNSCIKVRLDLQADKSPVVVKGPFFPQVVNPRYQIRRTNV